MLTIRKLAFTLILVSTACCATVPTPPSPETPEIPASIPDPLPVTIPPVNSASVEFNVPTPFELNVLLIRFHGPITAQTVDVVINGLNEAVRRDVKAVVFEIDSGGGEVDTGFALIKGFERLPFPVHCVVDGEADSMAFYILQGCTTRSMTRRSRLMIHEASWSTPIDLKDPTNFLNKMEEIQRVTHSLVEHAALRMKMPAKDILKRIPGRKQWWMNDEEALKYNAVDHVYDSTSQVVTELRKSLRLPGQSPP